MKGSKAAAAFAILVAVMMTIPLAQAAAAPDGNAANDGKELMASGLSTAGNDEEGKDAYNRVMTLESPDSYSDESFEPYGHGVDVPFMMNKQSELLFYQTSADSFGTGDITTFYDKLKSASDGDVLAGTKTSALKSPPADLQQAYFVKAVSFDPTGSGRDDHIAFIGLFSAGGNVRCYVWAYNTKSRSWSNSFVLGSAQNCNWMDDDLHVTDYQGTHFLSITAGDYDGDGKDTLVAYAAFTGEDGYSLYELECNNLTIRNHGNAYKGSALRHDWYGDWVSRKDTIKTKQACELDTGDINGDGLDDLVALTYIGDWGDKSQPAEFYRPMIKASYGTTGGSGFTQKCDFEKGAWKWFDGWKYNNMVSPGMSLGDIDKDGKDEIVTAGIKCLTKKKDSNTTEICNEIDSDLQTFVFIAGDNGGGKDSDTNIDFQGTIDTNAWTKSGFYTDEDIWNKSAVECVAVNGPGNPELIFINGTLYSYDSNNNKVSAVHTPAYFQNDGDNLSSKASTNMFVQSTAAGNFDGNSKGYEQVAFTVSCKTQSKRSYDYLRGVIGGTKYNGTTGQAGGYYSTSKDKMNDDYAWPGRGKDNASGYISEDQGLNCIVVACDNDNDGFMARYKEKTLLAADPEVLCVLQAPPYFEEVKDYLTDTSGTNYVITESYSFEKTTSDSVSYGVGVVAGMESPAMQMELTAGYALDWSKEFTKGHETEVEIEYTATEEDLVLVQKKPVVAYYYEVQDKDGNWSGEHMVVTVPCEPGLEPMGIDEYNAFAKYYNQQLEKSSHLKNYQNKADIPDFMKSTHKLGILNNQWLGHEGDPSGYIKWTNQKFKNDSAYRIIQSSPMRFGHNSEAVSWGKTEGNSVGETESTTHGFTYDATIAMGPNVGAASLYVGLTTSLQYMTGESTTTTNTKKTGVSCTVNGLKVKDMPASMKGNDYNFSFKMARWPSGLKSYVNGKAQDIPVYGYALSSVTRPSENSNITVQDQLDASEVEELVSDLPTVEELSTADGEKIAEIRNKYDALSDPAKTLVNEYDILVYETRLKLLKEGGFDLSGAKVALSATALTYNGKVQRPTVKTVSGLTLVEGLDYTATWSNATSKNAGTYTVTLDGIGLCSGSAKATYKINKAANSLSAKGKTVPVKLEKLKKKAQTLGVAKVVKFADKGQGKLSYKKASGNKKITVNKKNGKVTVKKGLKKGTYKVVVKITAAGDANYNKITKNVTFKVKVK